MTMSFLVDCEFCGAAAKRQNNDPETRFVQTTTGGTVAMTVCRDCTKKIDKLQKKEKDKQAEADELALKAMQEKLRLEAEQKAKTPQAIGLAELSVALTQLAQTQQAILEMLSRNQPLQPPAPVAPPLPDLPLPTVKPKRTRKANG